MLALTWGALLRVGEFTGALRRDLLLPCDTGYTNNFALLALREPKTRFTAARHQCAKLDIPDLLRVVHIAFARLQPHQKLWSKSSQTLRLRFKQLMCELGVGPSVRINGKSLDLGSLRPGGATWVLQTTEDSEFLRRRGRSCTAVLFALADVLAQLVPSYHEKSNLEDGYKLGRWDWRYTMAVVISALLFQVVILGRFYDYCDARFGSAVSWQSVSLKMLKMQGAFTLIYLPLAVFFFALSMCFVFRGFGDGTENCAVSVLAAAPGNLGSSLMMAAQLWPGDYLHSVAFWPPSHLINYVLIQRWSPNFRPIFDGVVVFSWNIYVLAGGAQREAVGPTLFGAAPGANGKIPPSVDCSKYSLDGFRTWCWAKMGDLWVRTKEGLVALWRNTCWATINSWKWLKHGCNWLRQHTLAGGVFFLSTLRWLVVMVLYCLGFVLLWILTALRVGGYWVLAILKVPLLS
eukprot:s1304_g10.t1